MKYKAAANINVGDKIVVKDYPGEHEVLVKQDMHPGQTIGFWIENGDFIEHKRIEKVIQGS